MTRDADTIIELMRANHSEVQIEQLKVKFPGADDDGLWFFTHPACNFEVQIGSSYGMCPFIIETNEHNEVVCARDIEEVIDTLKKWLHLI